MKNKIKDNKGNDYSLCEYGQNDNGKTVKAYSKDMPVWISPTKIRFPSGKIVSIDPNEASYEIYNFNKFEIVMKNVHPNISERYIMPIIVIKPFGFAFIPHRYYIPFVEFIDNPVKTDIKVLENYGDNMFKGNKKMSRPDKKKITNLQ